MHNKIDEKGKNKNFAFSVLRDKIIESIFGKNVKNIKKSLELATAGLVCLYNQAERFSTVVNICGVGSWPLPT